MHRASIFVDILHLHTLSMLDYSSDTFTFSNINVLIGNYIIQKKDGNSSPSSKSSSEVTIWHGPLSDTSSSSSFPLLHSLHLHMSVHDNLFLKHEHPPLEQIRHNLGRIAHVAACWDVAGAFGTLLLRNGFFDVDG